MSDNTKWLPPKTRAKVYSFLSTIFPERRLNLLRYLLRDTRSRAREVLPLGLNSEEEEAWKDEYRNAAHIEAAINASRKTIESDLLEFKKAGFVSLRTIHAKRGRVPTITWYSPNKDFLLAFMHHLGPVATLWSTEHKSNTDIDIYIKRLTDELESVDFVSANAWERYSDPTTMEPKVEKQLTIREIEKRLRKDLSNAIASTPEGELNFQDMLYTFLNGIPIGDLRHNEPTISLKGMAYIPDFSIPSLKAIIEVKMASKPNRPQTKITKELNQVISHLEAEEIVQHMFLIVYNKNHAIKNVRNFIQTLEEKNPEKVSVIVVPS